MAALGDQESRARNYILEGEKILNKRSFFGSLFGEGNQKFEDAAEQFSKAANCYKVGRKLKEAGDTYLLVAAMHEKLNSSYEAASAFMEAGKCYKDSSPADSMAAMKSALVHYTEMGKFNQAAKLLRDMGDIYEKDGMYEEARDAFNTSAEYFSGENSVQSANQCLLKVANIISKFINPPDYSGAAKIFEDLGRSCASVQILRMNAKAHFLNAALCLMASNDTVAAKMKIEEFKSVDYTFEGSRDCAFAEDLCQAMENYDSEAFATASFEYDQVTTLDSWKTSILVAIKRLIQTDTGTNDEPDLT